MTKVFYTTTEAAKVLGVSAGRVRQIIIKGEMVAQKVGRDLLIPPEAVERAKRRKTKPGPVRQIVRAVAEKKPAAKRATKKTRSR
jgi:excisionase family DNA binding protein